MDEVPDAWHEGDELVVEQVETTPTLQEIEAWHIGDGYATGPARLWDEDGRLCAIATQTAHLRRHVPEGH